ncbi:class I tRNA ligase family protein [bacterium]|nr:class I tRNA ligase family protein [bacterium]
MPVRQRFVKILDQKDALKKLNDNMNWFPTTMQKRSTDWIDNLHRDWNISRSRKF